MSVSTIIPELRESPYDCTYVIHHNWLNWALEYAFELAKCSDVIKPEIASRMVVQTLAGSNALRVIHMQFNGLTDKVTIDGVGTKLELYEYNPGPKVTQVEYEG